MNIVNIYNKRHREILREELQRARKIIKQSKYKITKKKIKHYK
jgi:acyl-CoA hydrolase